MNPMSHCNSETLNLLEDKIRYSLELFGIQRLSEKDKV